MFLRRRFETWTLSTCCYFVTYVDQLVVHLLSNITELDGTWLVMLKAPKSIVSFQKS